MILSTKEILDMERAYNRVLKGNYDMNDSIREHYNKFMKKKWKMM